MTVSLGERAYRTHHRVQERVYPSHGQTFLVENDGENIDESLHSAESFHTVIPPSSVNKPVGLHIDHVYVITMGYHKEKYYLILVVDDIDFV